MAHIHKSKLHEGDKKGKLTLIRCVGLTKVGHSYEYEWECRCDCGNKRILRERSLLKDDHLHSCGCIPKNNLTPGDSKRVSEAGKARATKRNKEGCNVDMLFREKTIATNTSGVQGVSWSKVTNKWAVYIGYKKRRAYLGSYEDFEDAIKVRQAGLKAAKEGTFEDFYFSLKGKKYEDNAILIKCKKGELS